MKNNPFEKTAVARPHFLSPFRQDFNMGEKKSACVWWSIFKVLQQCHKNRYGKWI